VGFLSYFEQAQNQKTWYVGHPKIN